jgi:hypothetical protein
VSASTNKKIVVERFDRESLFGFLQPQTGFQAHGIELLSQSGAVQLIPYTDIRTVCFVRDWEAPRSRERHRFTARPKLEGLWVRLVFRNGEELDAVLPNKLLELDPYGFSVVPPDATANNPRLWVPRQALTDLQVLGVVKSPLRPRRTTSEQQIKLFE